MDRKLDPYLYTATDFVVNDGSANAVTAVEISGVTVTLTLTNNVDNGDTVTVAYTSVGTRMKGLNTNSVFDWEAESVTNNVA